MTHVFHASVRTDLSSTLDKLTVAQQDAQASRQRCIDAEYELKQAVQQPVQNMQHASTFAMPWKLQLHVRIATWCAVELTHA